MRLTRLYLAGFKSFAAPTEILLPAERVAIVGPNGCGKSNLIDAIRWVLGESSAKQLRGQSLDDVIFAGSGQRPAASQAVVELSFDNSARRLSGPFGAYDQIVIRRSLGRDGQSRYTINQTRVRRRDVVDLFLGTGVGARSYSVIEQGQINRIVDAKPEDLRAYLEETAGISLYRERRRETENRIQQTQDNLSRLSDIADELGRQKSQLERQARTAERYRELQKKRRRQLVEQAAVQVVLAERASATLEVEWKAAEAQVTTAAERMAQVELQWTQQDEARTAAQSALQQIQAQQYHLAAEQAQLQGRLGELAARIESAEQQRQDDLAQRTRLETASAALQVELSRLAGERETVESQRQEAMVQRADAQAELRAADAHLNEMRAEWARSHDELARPQQDLAAARAEHAALLRQSQRLDAERAKASSMDSTEPMAALVAQIQDAETQMQALAQSQSESEAALVEQQAALAERTERAAAIQKDAQVLRQNADALQAERRGLERALASHQTAKGDMTGSERLIQRLAGAHADSWWGHALGAGIEAACVDDLDALVEAWRADQMPASGWWVSPDSERHESNQHSLEQTPTPSEALAPWLRDWHHTRHPAPSLTQALAQRHTLPSGHCFVLTDGWQVGRHWIGRGGSDQAAVRLAQQTRLAELQQAGVEAEIEAKQAHSESVQIQNQLAEQRKQVERQVAARHQQEQQRQRLHWSLEDLRRKYQQHERQQADRAAQVLRLEAEHAQLVEDMARLDETVLRLEQAVAKARSTRDDLNARQQSAEQAVFVLRRRAGEAGQQLQQLERAVDRNQHQFQQAQQSLARDEAQMAQIDQRLAQFADKLDMLITQQTERQAEFTALGARQHEIAQQEKAALDQVQQLTQAVQTIGAERHAAQRTHEQARAAVQALELQRAQLDVREDHAATALSQAIEQWRDDRETLDAEAIGRLADIPNIAEAQASELATLEQQIARLGAVNLTAIEAFAEAEARKSELDGQIEDVQSALDQLQEAIRTLDRQTRAQFRSVFDAVNARIGPLFVQLFGGGEARLELSGSDELDAGVLLFAKPPGKKVTQLSLLSGGERALTAVALIFALFELNPAPFCILDEVDAPLDEANVGRFCAMVSAMSDRVQFLFVTHNKTTMASASALVGVTMREAGVSRIVSVDVDRAVQLLES
jgi:chromosome segregation protein